MTHDENPIRRRLLAGSIIFMLLLALLALTAGARPGTGNGNGNNTEVVCHFLPVGGGAGSPPAPPHDTDGEGLVWVTLYVAPAAVPAHLAHGDLTGEDCAGMLPP